MQIPPFVSLCKYGFWSHERTHSIPYRSRVTVRRYRDLPEYFPLICSHVGKDRWLFTLAAYYNVLFPMLYSFFLSFFFFGIFCYLFIIFHRMLRLRFQSMCKEYHRHKLVKQAFHHWQNRLMNRRADRRYNGGLQRWLLWRDYLVTFSASIFRARFPRVFSARVWLAEILHFFAFAGKFSSCGFYDTRGMWFIVIFLRLWLER